MFGHGVRLTALGGLASAAFVHSSNSGHGSGFSHVQPSSYLDADNAGTGTVYSFSKIPLGCLVVFVVFGRFTQLAVYYGTRHMGVSEIQE
jgi:hypothetical protein